MTIVQRWGLADVWPVDGPCDQSGLAHALQHADLLHVAAHASRAGVFLNDALFDRAALESIGDRIRTTLLVLSACDAGNMEEPAAFLWSLVRRGVNVVAAVGPVNDYVSRVFFEEFYRALLPRRRALGTDLATAIALATAACSARLADHRGWAQTVDRLILFGDPSLRLILDRGEP